MVTNSNDKTVASHTFLSYKLTCISTLKKAKKHNYALDADEAKDYKQLREIFMQAGINMPEDLSTAGSL